MPEELEKFDVEAMVESDVGLLVDSLGELRTKLLERYHYVVEVDTSRAIEVDWILYNFLGVTLKP